MPNKQQGDFNGRGKFSHFKGKFAVEVIIFLLFLFCLISKEGPILHFQGLMVKIS